MRERRGQGQKRLKKIVQWEGDVFKISGKTRLRYTKSDVGFRGEQWYFTLLCLNVSNKFQAVF